MIASLSDELQTLQH